jgi:HD-GYP domain-containing protein (c-di-GMP phosphodiesterase class II)
MRQESPSDGYTPISLEVMRLETVPGFDLYLMGPKGPVLYRNKNLLFTDRVLHSLLENNVKYLYFKNEDEERFFAYMEKNLELIVNDEAVAPEKKAQLVYNTSANLARQMFQQPDSPELVQRASKVLDSVISLAARDENTYKNLIEVLPRDYYTHTHCANVATYSLALGKALGLSTSNGLWDLTLGAFLHDIGKARVPQSVLNKNGPLTRDEFEMIKQHVILGYQIIREIPAVPFGAYPALVQHHERLNGEGYPKGIRDVHFFARIVAVADAFDAITTNRPYKKAMTSYEALTLIKSQEGRYDESVITAMIETMAPRNYKKIAMA